MSQSHSSSKLNRVFFPRWFCQARSLGCGFVRWSFGTVRISLIHSCTSKLLWLGIWLPSCFEPSQVNLQLSTKSYFGGWVWFEIHNRANENSHMWTFTNFSSSTGLVLSPYLSNSLERGNSTFLRPFDPPLSARYREQSLLCFASRLSSLQAKKLLSTLKDVPRTRWCCQSLRMEGSSNRYTRIKPCVTD